MSKRNSREFWESARMNNATFRMYYDRLVSIAISMFEWHNLPDTIDPRYLELTLFKDGKILFFEDEVMGQLALKCMAGGTLNVYGIPNTRIAFSDNGYQKECDDTNSVIIWNNVLHTNSFNDVEQGAIRLADLQRTIDTNIKAQKTPLLIRATEKQRLSMKNLYKSYEGNEPYIFADDELRKDGIEVLNTNAPYVADKLYEAKHEVWNDTLTFLGVPTGVRSKRERLLVSEVSGDKASAIVQQFVRLNPRREACEQINKMFGTNISVTYRRLDDTALLDYELNVEEGLGQNEVTKQSVGLNDNKGGGNV